MQWGLKSPRRPRCPRRLPRSLRCPRHIPPASLAAHAAHQPPPSPSTPHTARLPRRPSFSKSISNLALGPWRRHVGCARRKRRCICWCSGLISVNLVLKIKGQYSILTTILKLIKYKFGVCTNVISELTRPCPFVSSINNQKQSIRNLLMRTKCSIEVPIQSSQATMELQGSIARELYSEILQSSSAGLDGGLTAAQADSDLHESDPGDSWYDDEPSFEDSVEKLKKESDMDREWQRRRTQFHTIGYRDGVIAGKEAAAQEGFNIGFKESVLNGHNWGLVRGITSAMACLPGGLKEKLVEMEETRNKFQRLHECVQSLSTTDALKLFYEDQKRKSMNQKENAKLSSTVTDHNDPSPDTSLLENYIQQLQSILNESAGIEGHLKIY